MSYLVYEGVPAVNGITAYTPRGGAKELWQTKAFEVILSGPAETGKTYGCLQKLDALMLKYPGAQAAIVRKTYLSMPGSVLQTLVNKVFLPGHGVQIYGGEKPEMFIYPNGSKIWVGGMDKPEKVLSSERDFIYVNQAEELRVSDWETLATRATGRSGYAPYSQLFGDCNPSYPTHWIKQRTAAGDLKLIPSRHTDNPMLYDDNQNLTKQGERSMKILASLTGLRRKRLYEGLWVQAEGAVYELFDSQVHVIPRFEIPREWRRIRVIDFGYTNPFVCQWWAINPDGIMFMYREIYHTRRTVRAHSVQIKDLSVGELIEATVCDHDAEDRATLEENGIKTLPAQKPIKRGIEKVQDRLKIQDNGKAGLYLLEDSLVEVDPDLVEAHLPLCTADEFPGYVWGDNKEVPVDADNHAMDTTRYGVFYLSREIRKATSRQGSVRR